MARSDYTHKRVVGSDNISRRVELTEEEIDQKVAEEEAHASWVAANGYKTKRLATYPQLAAQLDMLYHDMTAGKGDKTGDWYTAIAKVKSDNPKP